MRALNLSKNLVPSDIRHIAQAAMCPDVDLSERDERALMNAFLAAGFLERDFSRFYAASAVLDHFPVFPDKIRAPSL